MKATAGSPFHFLATNYPAEGITDSSKIDALVSSALPFGINDTGSKAERGRTVQRTNRPYNPLEKAESRHRMKDATLEVDTKGIKLRSSRSTSLFEDTNDPQASLDDDLLEPCPHNLICSNVFEILAEPASNGRDTLDMPSSIAGFANTNSGCPKSSLAAVGQALSSASSPIAYKAPGPQPKPKFDEDVSAKTSREAWTQTTDEDWRPSGLNLLPAEVLCQIYGNLSPTDFNSARHSCRLWYINSLDRSLLETMLKRGGWSTNINSDLPSSLLLDPERVNREWFLSKRLARECALGPDWTGNGLRARTETSTSWYNGCDSKSTPFIQTTTTDFTEVGVHYPGVIESTSGISFTVSSCGKFLMVAHGCLVYIYELNCSRERGEAADGRQNGSLRPVTSVICPRRVLACSMDTSSHRYAIAVLLDGRMGLVCDLTSLRDRDQRMGHPGSFSSSSRYRNRVSIKSSRSREPALSPANQPFVSTQLRQPTESERDIWEDTVNEVSATDQSRTILFGQNGSQGQTTNLFPPSSMPVESSIPILYTPLCSADDLPRSVALCPQRRCVAFGCSSGIELHWVDALTGQDLNRWFPLTAPSDYLYFLPPRPGVDSAKKLRLISSAGRPGENSVIAERYGSVRSGGSFWSAQPRDHGFWPAGLAAAGGSSITNASHRDSSDHYQAVPLSDGYHILFTDPATGFLCLGSDAPIGGPTKLLRKIWFAGPQGHRSPVTYIGGSDLRWGVRVVAAYGSGAEQSIWLFSIPPDVFAESQAERGGGGGGVGALFDETGSPEVENKSNRAWVEWWGNNNRTSSYVSEPGYGASPHALLTGRDTLWPLQVRGQEIGRCNGVVDLAMDAGPAMTIWAFGKDGVAKTWEIGHRGAVVGVDDTPHVVVSGSGERRITVSRDGTLRHIDADGDTEMADISARGDAATPLMERLPPSAAPADTTTPDDNDQETFDGSSMSLANSVILPLRTGKGQGQEQKVWCCTGPNGAGFGGQNNKNNAVMTLKDADGDVVMTTADYHHRYPAALLPPPPSPLLSHRQLPSTAGGAAVYYLETTTAEWFEFERAAAAAAAASVSLAGDDDDDDDETRGTLVDLVDLQELGEVWREEEGVWWVGRVEVEVL